MGVPAGWPAPPTHRRRGWLRVLFGVVALVAGLIAVGTGIVSVVGERERIEDEAVARGVVGETATFQATQARRYTVYLIFGGRIGNDLREERVIARTACATSSGASFTGSRQGSAVTLGRASTVGRFDAPAGEIAVRCSGPYAENYIVTPGGASLMGGVLLIVGGAFLAVGGILLLIWGLVGRRV